MEFIALYQSTVLALGVMALLMFIQLVIADVVAIKSKHTPGTSIPEDHELFLFRASRTVANTNENVGMFLLVCLFCILSEAPAELTAYAAWAFVISRLFFALFYYANIKVLRSSFFVISFLSLIALLVIGFSA